MANWFSQGCEDHSMGKDHSSSKNGAGKTGYSQAEEWN